MEKKNPYKIDQELEAEDILAKLKRMGLPENFCPVPFSTVIAEPDGRIGSCRLKGAEFEIGWITEKSLDEIWNDDFIRQWRREFLTGDVKICEREVKHRGCNLCSENNKLLDLIQVEEVQTEPIVKFTANFNGYCNLECKMCHIWQKPNGLYDEIGFWEKGEKEIFPFIKEIDFLSGEPFLQKDTWRLIDMISEINPECQWLFTTNAAYTFSKYMQSELDKIHIKHMMISIDSLRKDVFEEIRIKGDLSQVLNTSDEINKYRNERPSRGLNTFPILLGYLVQKDNWKEVGDILDYCQKMNFRPHIQFCYEPVEHSVLDFPKEKIKEMLDWYLENMTWQQMEMGIRSITPLLDKVDPIDKAQFFTRALEKKNG